MFYIVIAIIALIVIILIPSPSENIGNLSKEYQKALEDYGYHQRGRYVTNEGYRDYHAYSWHKTPIEKEIAEKEEKGLLTLDEKTAIMRGAAKAGEDDDFYLRNPGGWAGP